VLRHVDDPVLAEAIKGDALHNISFEEWYRLFIEFAKVATMEGKFKEAQDTLGSALQANIFYHSSEKQASLRLHMITAAIHAGDTQTVSDVVRWFCLQRALTNDVYRLYPACLSRGPDVATIFAMSPNQKHFLRQVRILEKQAKRNPHSLEYKNPVLYTLYGHICAAVRNHLDATQYYTKAYRLAPNDPMINLSLGIAHLQRAMQRKSQNRHHHIICGFTYIFNYQELVGETQETCYNLGRAFHHLGGSFLPCDTPVTYNIKIERSLSISDAVL
jgi:general transcription factor 3C polypeptide 3 (transcription factor C subunit 4)